MIVLEEFFLQLLIIIGGIFKGVAEAIILFWWIPLLFYLFYSRVWRLWDQSVKNLNWKLLEIKIPKENIKTPRAMEQVLISLYSMHGSMEWEDIWIHGKVFSWASLEIIGSEKGIRFYIYAPSKIRNLVESSFFSQYPEAEIIEVDDYTKELPDDLPNEEYDLMGVDLALKNDNYLPMRTYPYFFEGGTSIREEKRTDPISNVSEIMSNLKEDERIWIQILIKPADNGWEKEGQKVINEIAVKGWGKKKKSKPLLVNAIEEVKIFLKNFVKAMFEPPVWPEKEKEATRTFLSPVDQDVIKAIENKISKLGYITVVRFLLIDKKSKFNNQNFYSMMGAFRQFTDNNLNNLKPVSRTSSFAKPRFFLKDITLLRKKKAIFKKYINRSYPDSDHDFFSFNPSVLNIEEVATIFHFPVSDLVEASGVLKLPTKKGAPPANLPIG